MSDIDIAEKLKDLFRNTGSTHNQAFFKLNNEDAEWLLWYYADYLP
ncbi:MAG TPA: hypothetical protein VI935_04400 [Thermodesulfobacteriota bacterium]|nr:hypothetical protein [Thermodesulfobacteriota bacterium]